MVGWFGVGLGCHCSDVGLGCHCTVVGWDGMEGVSLQLDGVRRGHSFTRVGNNAVKVLQCQYFCGAVKAGHELFDPLHMYSTQCRLRFSEYELG